MSLWRDFLAPPLRDDLVITLLFPMIRFRFGGYIPSRTPTNWFHLPTFQLNRPCQFDTGIASLSDPNFTLRDIIEFTTTRFPPKVPYCYSEPT